MADALEPRVGLNTVFAQVQMENKRVIIGRHDGCCSGRCPAGSSNMPTNYRTVALSVVLFIGCIGCSKGHTSLSNRGPVYPITPVSDVVLVASDPASAELRVARNNAFHGLRPRGAPVGTSRAPSNLGVPGAVDIDSIPSGILIESEVSTPDIPQNNDTVVVGVVSRSQSFLSADHRALYTEYLLRVDEVLRNTKHLKLSGGSLIAIERMGGTLRLASGRILRSEVYGPTGPLFANHKYLLFLRYHVDGELFGSIKNWELVAGRVAAVDEFDIKAEEQGLLRPTIKGEMKFLHAVRGQEIAPTRQ